MRVYLNLLKSTWTYKVDYINFWKDTELGSMIYNTVNTTLTDCQQVSTEVSNVPPITQPPNFFGKLRSVGPLSKIYCHWSFVILTIFIYIPYSNMSDVPFLLINFTCIIPSSSTHIASKLYDFIFSYMYVILSYTY